MKICKLIVLLLVSATAIAQTDSTKKITFSGYGELYYSGNNSTAKENFKPGFVYNHKKLNEINANLILVKAQYKDGIVRGNLGLMVGNYAEFNLAAEPSWAQFVYEANLGVKLSKKKNIWLDAGIMPSHIGFESAVSADCWTLTRSMLAEKSPYYEAGAKVSYTSKNEKIYLAFLVLNGWQRISNPSNTESSSYGVQINYKPNSKTTLNYSNFIRKDSYYSQENFRHFHNFYAQYEPTEKLGIIAGFDIGKENYVFNSDSISFKSTGIWYSPVVIVRKKIGDKSKIALRGEYYDDKNQIVISAPIGKGFQTFGFSSNYDYNITPNVQVRLEYKVYHSKHEFFDNFSSLNSLEFTTNLTLKL